MSVHSEANRWPEFAAWLFVVALYFGAALTALCAAILLKQGIASRAFLCALACGYTYGAVWTLNNGLRRIVGEAHFG